MGESAHRHCQLQRGRKEDLKDKLRALSRLFRVKSTALTMIYNAICKANVVGQVAKAKTDLQNYAQFIFRVEQANIEELTGEDLRIVAEAGADSASGMDQWSPSELKLLSPLAFQCLAEFLNEIEKGKKWPD